ncbi:hypothetical protein Tco_1544389, partial [Tanacetum coccineum]
MSSECNNIKLSIQNDKSKVVFAMCKQCLITSNHDVYVLKYMNDMNSCVNIFNANVSNTANKKKHKPKVKKPKKVGSKERFAPPKPRNLLHPSLGNLELTLGGSSNMFMVRRLGMLKAYDRKSEASYKFRLEVSGN